METVHTRSPYAGDVDPWGSRVRAGQERPCWYKDKMWYNRTAKFANVRAREVARWQRFLRKWYDHQQAFLAMVLSRNTDRNPDQDGLSPLSSACVRSASSSSAESLVIVGGSRESLAVPSVSACASDATGSATWRALVRATLPPDEGEHCSDAGDLATVRADARTGQKWMLTHRGRVVALALEGQDIIEGQYQAFLRGGNVSGIWSHSDGVEVIDFRTMRMMSLCTIAYPAVQWFTVRRRLERVAAPCVACAIVDASPPHHTRCIPHASCAALCARKSRFHRHRSSGAVRSSALSSVVPGVSTWTHLLPHDSPLLRPVDASLGASSIDMSPRRMRVLHDRAWLAQDVVFGLPVSPQPRGVAVLPTQSLETTVRCTSAGERDFDAYPQRPLEDACHTVNECESIHGVPMKGEDSVEWFHAEWNAHEGVNVPDARAVANYPSVAGCTTGVRDEAKCHWGHKPSVGTWLAANRDVEGYSIALLVKQKRHRETCRKRLTLEALLKKARVQALRNRNFSNMPRELQARVRCSLDVPRELYNRGLTRKQVNRNKRVLEAREEVRRVLTNEGYDPVNYTRMNPCSEQEQVSSEDDAAGESSENGDRSSRSGHGTTEVDEDHAEQSALCFICSKELMLMSGIHYPTAVRLRLLHEGELVELINPPVIDEASGFPRAEVRACRDGLTGFVTYGGLEPRRADGGNLQRTKTNDRDEASLRTSDSEPTQATVGTDAKPSLAQQGDAAGTRRFGALITFSGIAGSMRRCWSNVRRAALRCKQSALQRCPCRSQRLSQPSEDGALTRNTGDHDGNPQVANELHPCSDSESHSSNDPIPENRAWFVAGRRRKRARSWGRQFRHPDIRSLSPRLTSNDFFSVDRCQKVAETVSLEFEDSADGSTCAPDDDEPRSCCACPLCDGLAEDLQSFWSIPDAACALPLRAPTCPAMAPVVPLVEPDQVTDDQIEWLSARGSWSSLENPPPSFRFRDPHQNPAEWEPMEEHSHIVTHQWSVTNASPDCDSIPKIAIAVNLGKRERQKHEGALEACAKEWTKLRTIDCWGRNKCGRVARCCQ